MSSGLGRFPAGGAAAVASAAGGALVAVVAAGLGALAQATRKKLPIRRVEAAVALFMVASCNSPDREKSSTDQEDRNFTEDQKIKRNRQLMFQTFELLIFCELFPS
jgi:putative Ca2+/H+ antiporter (TMEM165/GDT1 family)